MQSVDYVRYLLALVIVLGAILLLGKLARYYDWTRLGVKLTARQARRLRVTDMQAIDTRHRLVIARCDATEYLLAVGPENVTLLDKIPATDDPAAPASNEVRS